MKKKKFSIYEASKNTPKLKVFDENIIDEDEEQ